MAAVSRCGGDCRLVDRRGLELPAFDLGGELAHGARDLVAAAIVEGDDQLQAAVAGGQAFGLLDQADNVGRQPVALADDA